MADNQKQFWQFEVFGQDPEQIGFFGNAGIIIPSGDTSERPSSPVEGHIRLNTDTTTFESFFGGIWQDFGVGSGTTFLSLTDTPASYIGLGDRILRVSNAESGVEFSTVSILPSGAIDVSAVVNYETLVTSDDIITNKKYVDDQDALRLALTGGTVTGNITMSGATVTGLPAVPVGSSDAASKSYVDSLSAGLDPKESVRLATTGAITLSGNQSIDGFLTVDGDRILVKNQGTASENGIYIADSGAWSRAPDMDGTPLNEVSGGNFTFVEEGSANAGTGWVVVFDGVINVGVDSINWTQFTGGGAFLPLAGGTMTGSIIMGAASVQFIGDPSGDPPFTFSGDLDTGMTQVGGVGFIDFESNGALNWRMSPAPGAFLPGVTLSQDIGSTGLKIRDIFADHALFNFGAVGDPSYSFEGDTNTGMFNGGGDVLRFSTGGTDRFGIDALGNVDVNKGELRFVETGAGTDFIGFVAPATISASFTLTLPSVDAAGALVSDGVGNLSFSAGLTPGALSDVDGDTQIQVEESSDEDIVRIDVGDSPIGYAAQPDIFILSAASWIVTMGTAGSGTAGAPITLSAGDGGSTSGDGADITLNAGSATASGSGGDINLNAGTGASPGGNVTITAGNSTSFSPGGALSLVAGDGGTEVGGVGGGVTITSGNAGAGSGESGGVITFVPGIDDPGTTVSHVEISGVGGASNAPQLRFREGGGGLEFIALKAPDLLGGDTIFTLPGVDGSANQALVTDGLGNLSFSSSIASSVSLMEDADGDTKIDVEEGADDDTIRMDVGDSFGTHGPVIDIFLLSAPAWTVNMGTATTDTIGGTISFTAGKGGTTSAGGAITITGGDGGATSGNGGNVNLIGGDADGSGAGGTVNITAGTGASPGGNINLTAGTSTSTDPGGSVTITGGVGGTGAGGLGGGVSLVAGNAGVGSGADGGDVALTPGSGDGVGVEGQVLLGVDGSPTAPALSFSSDDDNGLYRSALDQLSFTISGTEKLRVGTDLKVLSGDVELDTGEELRWTDGSETFSITSVADIITSYSLTFPGALVAGVLESDGSGNISFTTSPSVTRIIDSDSDTKIDVEEGADDDIIRMDVGNASGTHGPVADVFVLSATNWTVSMGAASTDTIGAPVTLSAGKGGTASAGGVLTLNAGDGGAISGNGADIVLNAGDADGGGSGGDVNLNAGTGASAGGNVNITAGGSTSTDIGGNVTLVGGVGGTGVGGDGGPIVVQGGGAGVGSDGNGGDIELRPGALDGVGVDGSVRLIGANTAGELRFEDDTGGEFVAIKAPSAVSVSHTMTLPTAVATVNNAPLVSDTSGNLSFSTSAVGTVLKFAQDNTAATASEQFTHNLGSVDVIVQVYDLTVSPRAQFIPVSIEVDDINNVTVTLGSAPSGAGEYRVVIMA